MFRCCRRSRKTKENNRKMAEPGLTRFLDQSLDKARLVPREDQPTAFQPINPPPHQPVPLYPQIPSAPPQNIQCPPNQMALMEDMMRQMQEMQSQLSRLKEENQQLRRLSPGLAPIAFNAQGKGELSPHELDLNLQLQVGQPLKEVDVEVQGLLQLRKLKKGMEATLKLKFNSPQVWV
ncbi:hypothetical protein 2 [Beihai tombus-like virus 10]|uniref:hypothetical protein 2 n=1 Tax=Beihai tombus-like virus 10 TaxID=1922713 RepID=UPI00090A03E2|nr:hypothetical protein 2 [Beihai tombus-like virus 10]APG76196.1 hypothetical protein 2 [Beihai tombus-like virus 10]